MVLLSSEKCYEKGDTKRITILIHRTKGNMSLLFFLNTGNICLIQLFLIFLKNLSFIYIKNIQYGL